MRGYKYSFLTQNKLTHNEMKNEQQHNQTKPKKKKKEIFLDFWDFLCGGGYYTMLPKYLYYTYRYTVYSTTLFVLE